MNSKEVIKNQQVIKSRRVLPRRALAHKVRQLSEIDAPRAAWAIIRQWIVIIACFMAATHYNQIWITIAMMIVIATRQHALGILMHDATHYRLFNNKVVNDWIGDLFCALPVGLSTEGYRYEHLLHHVNTNTQKDPYYKLFQQDPIWHWPKQPWQAVMVFVGDLTGLNAKKNFFLVASWAPYRHLVYPGKYPAMKTDEKLRLLIYTIGLISLLFVFNLWIPYLILWLIPSMTLTLAMTRLRTIAEHLALESTNELNDTRHVDATFLEKIAISPLNINYHIDHHIYPSVPYYNLPQLHEELLQLELYQKQARLVPNYTSLNNGVLGELIEAEPARQFAGATR